MKRRLFNPLLFTALVVSLSARRTSVPRLDYKALARTSVRLGMDIRMEDDHELYLEAAQWIGTPYRGGGEAERGTDCSETTCQIYEKVCHIKLQRSTGSRKKENSKVVRQSLRESDLAFFSSRKSHRKMIHVGIYFKDRKLVHTSTSQGVIVSDFDEPYYRTHWISGGRVRK